MHHATMRSRTSLTLAAAVVAGVLAGCGGEPPAEQEPEPAQPITVVGGVHMAVPDGWTVGQPCIGPMVDPAKYAEVKDGAQVVVADSSGKTVAVGALTVGNVEQKNGAGKTCTLRFTIGNVPGGLGFYKVKVAGQESEYAEDKVTAPLDITLN